MQHISLYSQTNCHSTHYDHHSVSLSAGVIISIQSFTSKNAVFFIGALTEIFPPRFRYTVTLLLAIVYTPDNNQHPKTIYSPKSVFIPHFAIQDHDTDTLGGCPLFQDTNRRRLSPRNRSLPELTVNTDNHCFTANYHAISQACLTIIAG